MAIFRARAQQHGARAQQRGARARNRPRTGCRGIIHRRYTESSFDRAAMPVTPVAFRILRAKTSGVNIPQIRLNGACLAIASAWT